MTAEHDDQPTGVVRVASAQLRLDIDDPQGALRASADAIERAAEAGARVVVLPELASTGYCFRDAAELRARAERTDGPTLAAWSRAAQRHHIVVVGGFAELGEDGNVYNSAALIDHNGVQAQYRKVHPWGTEADLFTRGSAPPPVIDTDVGRIAMMICYDVEFPEWVRLAATGGADLLCVPANWPTFPWPEGERPNTVIKVQAAAATNRLPIALADRAGSERGVDWVGGSVITDADGYALTPMTLGAEGLLIADVDLAATRDKSIGEHNDVFGDRRPELYGIDAQCLPRPQ